jgi:hypothetical protein
VEDETRDILVGCTSSLKLALPRSRASRVPWLRLRVSVDVASCLLNLNCVGEGQENRQQRLLDTAKYGALMVSMDVIGWDGVWYGCLGGDTSAPTVRQQGREAKLGYWCNNQAHA